MACAHLWFVTLRAKGHLVSPFVFSPTRVGDRIAPVLALSQVP